MKFIRLEQAPLSKCKFKELKRLVRKYAPKNVRVEGDRYE